MKKEVHLRTYLVSYFASIKELLVQHGIFVLSTTRILKLRRLLTIGLHSSGMDSVPVGYLRYTFEGRRLANDSYSGGEDELQPYDYERAS